MNEFRLPTPPRQSITPKPRQIIEDFQLFQEAQYNFLKKMEDHLNTEKPEEDEELLGFINDEVSNYENIWAYIDNL